MRIVGGRLGGRRFPGPPGDRTRPTSERVREAIASALDARGRIAGAVVLDLYAGTGALAFEMLSRGAEHATLVERDRVVAEALRKSATALGTERAAAIVNLELGPEPSVAARVRRALPRPADLVFADPPYAEVDSAVRVLERFASEGLFADDALLVLEHARKQPPKSLGSLASIAAYEYGDTRVAFLGPRAAQSDS